MDQSTLVFTTPVGRFVAYSNELLKDADDNIGKENFLYKLVRPRNSFFLVVANFCYQGQDQVAKQILW